MAEIESKYNLDVKNVLDGLDQIINKSEQTEKTFDKLSKTDPFKEAAKNAANLDKELSEGVKSYTQIQASAEAYKEEIKKLTAEQDKLIAKRKEFEAAGKYDEYTKQLESVQERIGNLTKSMDVSTRSAGGLRGMIGNVSGKIKEMITNSTQAESTLGRFLPAATRLFGAVGVAVAAATVILYRYRQSYLEMNDALLTVSGSQKNVTNNMEVLDTVADQLNITLREITSAYGTFSSQGLKPTGSQMKDLGILAKELKTDFGTLSKAIVEADKGNLTALQNLGVQAVTNGNKIKLSFRGVTTEFTKGSGDSIKALDQISRQIEKTENSAEKIGRLDFADKIAKGMVDAEQAVSEAAESTDKKAYPAFDRFFRLISNGKNSVLEMAEAFGIWVGIGWEHIKNDAMILVAALGYLPDALKNGLTAANKNFADSKNAFLRNRETIFKQEALLQSRVGQDQGGSLTSPGAKLTPDDKEGIARQKKQRQELLKAEKDLKDALLKLEKDYGKDQLESLINDRLAYIKKKKELDLQEVDLEEKKFLTLKQIVAGAKKGNFDKDGKPVADKSVQLSAQEKAPFDFSRQLISDRAYLEEAKFVNENEKKITEIISNEYQRQLQATEYKYEELFKLAKQSGVDIAKLEKQKQKELAKIELEKGLSDIEKKAAQQLSDAEINIIRAQISGRMSLELQARRGLLQLEKSFILEKIKLLEASADPEAKARLAGLYKAIAEIDLGLKGLSAQEKSVSPIDKLLGSLGFTDEALSAVDIAAGSIQKSVSDLYSTLNSLSQQRISRLDDEINKKKEQVDAEKELNAEGVANNLSLRQKELQDLQASRERALKDQQRIQKQQLIADTITQTSSLITAASKVMAGFSSIPIVGVGLGIAAVALMLGAFAASKVKAFQLTKEQNAQQYEHGGEVGGKRHSEGGTIIEAEKGEYVTNRKSTSKYYDLIEAINKDNRSGILDYLVMDLLGGTGVGMSEPEREKDLAIMREYKKEIQDNDDELLNEVRELKKELRAIKNGTNRIPKSQLVNAGPNKYAEVSDNSIIVRTLPDF